jgi:tetratricopeptide (TPR) repeat protein
MPFKKYYIISFFAISVLLILIFSYRYDYTHYQLKSSFAIEDTKSSEKIQYFIQLGDYYLDNRDYDEAIGYYDQVLEIDSENVDALAKKARTLAKLNDWYTYENFDNTVRMLYPSDWNKTSIPLNINSSAIAYFQSPNDGFMNIVIEDLDPKKNITLDKYVESGIEYSKSLDNYKYTLKKIIVGNIPAERIEYELSSYPSITSDLYTADNYAPNIFKKTDFKGIQVIMLQENKAYIITYMSPESIYLNELPIVENMISTIEILSVEPEYGLYVMLAIFIFFIGCIIVALIVKAMKRLRSSFNKS